MAIGRRGKHGGCHGSSATQGRRGGSAMPDGRGILLLRVGATQRRDDPPSSQAPFSSTADPSVTTSTAVRGPTCGKKTVLLAKSATGGNLSVTFDALCCQPICVNAERFNNEIGYIVSHHNIFHHKEWRLVPENERAPFREYLLDDIEMAKRTPHPDLKKEQQKDWEMLCDHWSFEKFKEWSVKNIEAQSKRKWESRDELVSTPRHYIRRGESLTLATGQIETWRQYIMTPIRDGLAQILSRSM
ncbi:hypothetical protein PanWU01x14_127940 [Parasponia andersonii]|uniref:Uncharacterized protein n=1 Tax=Parasponia andersonii TaxID=3476 RepID=A0A2P5CSK8_PARAD|nr:hypothetical protein PanWU01x14_127940 [Parasponia andersonii]